MKSLINIEIINIESNRIQIRSINHLTGEVIEKWINARSFCKRLFIGKREKESIAVIDNFKFDGMVKHLVEKHMFIDEHYC